MKSANNYISQQRILFHDGNKYILMIEGKLSIDNDDSDIVISIETDEEEYKQVTVHIGDNITYFAEQTEPTKRNPYHYNIITNPTL